MIALIFASLGVFAMSRPAYAQDDTKLRNDPTYSTHNYKHPNKSAVARGWESKQGVTVGRPMPSQEPLANYKRQVPGQPTGNGIVVNHTPSTDVADRNYKMQRPLRAGATSTTPDIETKRRDQRPAKDKSSVAAD
ncbi:hypothetical protein GCM10027341_53890 [Spirosoma knui]